MIELKKIEIEYIICAALSVIAFFISFLLGLISGNTVGDVIVKSIIFLFAFAVIGYISIFIVKKYVPELYKALSGTKEQVISANTVTEESEKPNIIDESETNEKTDSGDINNEEIFIKDDDNILESDITNIESKKDTTVISNTINKKIKSEQDLLNTFKYEPKIVAQAVRTMMKKDES